MNDDAYIPERGDIIWLNFNPQAGHEQAGLRPAAVISPSIYNEKTHLIICCPITNQQKGYPFEVMIPGAMRTSGVVLADHVKSMDWRIRGAKFIEKLPDDIIEEILAKLRTLIK